MRKLLHIIDAINERVGSISNWLLLLLVIVILYEVIARYVFNKPTTWGFNSFRMISAVLVVFGWAYAQRHNSHIRVDILYTRFSLRKKAFVDVIGTGLLFLPLFASFIVLVAQDVQYDYHCYVTLSHLSGIPTNVIYQSLILIGLCLFWLQFLARFMRDIYILLKGRPQ
jgi:TRAP-type mannitol/chloroaromatic compound transport system permease small subunit